jgi:hypothetical protein
MLVSTVIEFVWLSGALSNSIAERRVCEMMIERGRHKSERSPESRATPRSRNGAMRQEKSWHRQHISGDARTATPPRVPCPSNDPKRESWGTGPAGNSEAIPWCALAGTTGRWQRGGLSPPALCVAPLGRVLPSRRRQNAALRGSGQAATHSPRSACDIRHPDHRVDAPRRPSRGHAFAGRLRAAMPSPAAAQLAPPAARPHPSIGYRCALPLPESGIRFCACPGPHLASQRGTHQLPRQRV